MLIAALTETRNLSGSRVNCSWRGLKVLNAALNWVWTYTDNRVTWQSTVNHAVV